MADGTGENYMLCDEYIELWKTVRRKSAEAGFLTMNMPEKVGGGYDALEFVIVLKRIKNRNPNGFHYLMVGGQSRIMVPMYDDDY